MIRMYKLIPNPIEPNGRGGETAMDHAWHVSKANRWSATLHDAELAAKALAIALGPRPCPGHQNTRPYTFAVYGVDFLTLTDLANRYEHKRVRLSEVTQQADGSVSQPSAPGTQRDTVDGDAQEDNAPLPTRDEAVQAVRETFEELNKARKSQALCKRDDSRAKADERVRKAEQAYARAAKIRDRVVAKERKRGVCATHQS